MSLQPGQMLSHYRLTEKVGEGGMGVVWKAVDTTLDREVAIKVLPDLFAQDSERLARFEREAKFLASLNHPNISAVFGLHESGGARFLAMELIPGKDLAHRLQKGRLPVEETMQIALQLAEALEAAHEHGVIHRDLKPANIQLTPDGKVKVLDFGLAKALAGDAATSGSIDMSLSPTLAAAGTMAGVILGTAAYMSPEQARGKPVDSRSDIWAFGAVLYEMLSGRKLFEGETVSDTLASVLKTDPEWGALPTDLPPALRSLLTRCLHRDPKQRLRDIGDARIVLQEILSGRGPEAQTPTSVAPVPRKQSSMTMILAVALAVAATATAAWFLRPRLQPPAAVHLEAAVGGDLPLFQAQGAGTVLSPDGAHLIYNTGTASDVSATRLRHRSFGRLDDTELTGALGGYNAFFSPDSQWVGFVTPSQLKKVSIAGGTPLVLCPVALSRGASWGESGQIVFAPTPAGGLSMVQAAGGTPTELTKLENGELSHRWPQFLPGGKQVLFSSYTSGDRNAGKIEVVDIATGRRTVVQQGGTYGRYARSGHLMYVNNGTLFAAHFDAGSLKMTVIPSPVLQGLSSNAEGGAQYDVSANGTLVYLTGHLGGTKNTLMWSDRKGAMTAVSQTRREYQSARISPDGKRLVSLVITEGNFDIWVHDIERDTQTRLTFDEARELYPIWSPDGRFVYFSSNRGGKWGIYRKRSDGTGDDERLSESDVEIDPYNVSPDGRMLGYHDQSASGDLWLLPLDGTSKPYPFFKSSFAEGDPFFSPDGRFVAYDSDESGRWEVYVRPTTGTGGKWQVSTQGGELARWSSDGRFILYKERSGGIWSAPVKIDGDALEVGRPEKLFDLPAGFQYEWDATADGSRFLFVQLESTSTGGSLNLVKLIFNWFDELKQQAGAR